MTPLEMLRIPSRQTELTKFWLSIGHDVLNGYQTENVCKALKPFESWSNLNKNVLPLLNGTDYNPNLTLKRGNMVADWLIRVYTPPWLELVPELVGYANQLKSLDELVEEQQFRDCSNIVDAAYNAAWKVANNAASNAAWNAAYNAAWNAAYSAAYSAAHNAGYSAAYNAAYGAAYSAARTAAHNAAFRAGEQVLQPVVDKLIVSANALIVRMVEVTCSGKTQ